MKQMALCCVVVSMLLMLASCSFYDALSSYLPVASTSADTLGALPETIASTQQTEAATTEAIEPIPTEAPEDEAFVRIEQYVEGIVIDLKYATTDNFTGQIIYNSGEAWLRYGTVKKLMLVQQELAEYGYRLKLWDGFRPPSAQFKLWEICPDPTYVSDPNKGFSNHSRGNTVDVTLVDSSGKELVMPTGFVDFSALADRDYSDCSAEAARNAILLEEIMEKYGFKGYRGEWWHYTDTDSYEVEQVFVP